MDLIDAGGSLAFVARTRIRASAEFGSIDAIFPNSGPGPGAPVPALRTTEWTRMIDVTINGVPNGSPPVWAHASGRSRVISRQPLRWRV